MLALAAFALCAVVCLPSCGNQAKTSDDSGFKPDPAYATIDKLADFLITDQQQPATLEEIAKHVEAQTLALKSYWHLNHKGEKADKADETACQDLSVLADSLDGGSTMDMVRCGQIRCAIDGYFTAKEYSEKYSDNKLYQNEMQQWLALESQLKEFYGDLAQVANWGGTIVQVNTAYAFVGLAHDRLVDYAELHKGGSFASSEMPLAEARTQLIQELEDAKSVDEAMVDDPEFKKTVQGLRACADRIVTLLDNWLAARSELCKSEGIPDAHTAHFIEKTARRILEMIEG